MKSKKAFSAGITGAVVMTVLMFLGRAFGLTALNLEMALGSMLTQTLGAATWILGFGMHLIAGGVFALVYAWGFENISHHSGAGTGTWYGVIHTLISGIVVLGLMPAVHPLIPEVLAAPGMFAINYGALTATAFIALHLIYGAVVGSMYGPLARPEVVHLEDEYRRAA